MIGKYQIGLFWILPRNQIISHVIDSNQSSGGHKKYWQSLRDKKDPIALRFDWKHYLRGRLIRDLDDSFRVVSDLTRLKDDDIKIITQEFNVTTNITIAHNTHYLETNPSKSPDSDRLSALRPI